MTETIVIRQIMKIIAEKSGNKYHNSPFERGVGVCYNSNIIYFLIFLQVS